MSKTDLICPNCNENKLIPFYSVQDVPVHSVLLMKSRIEAINYKKGDIQLGFCPDCNFISNMLFDASFHHYSSDYEETQGFSSTFNSFHKKLAEYLIKKYNLHNKDIIEIGCGKGDFLTLLCELGGNRGVGFDPAFIEDRKKANPETQVTFIKDFYAEKYSHFHGDFVCCKMTLEHIHQTKKFIDIVKRSLKDQDETIIFFQVPNLDYIFDELAFWDIYYEHCSYFSSYSLSYLFRQAGLDVTNVWTDYDNQYLMIEAKYSKLDHDGRNKKVNRSSIFEETVQNFSESANKLINQWQVKINEFYSDKKKVVLWGGGSKAVAFLTTLKIMEQIEYAVDINPYKFNTFLAGTGQKIVAPEFLKEYQPDVVIIMNPVYVAEIKQDLLKMELSPEVIPISNKLN